VGCIQIIVEAHRRLRDNYELEPRGLIEVKGKRKATTWLSWRA